MRREGRFRCPTERIKGAAARRVGRRERFAEEARCAHSGFELVAQIFRDHTTDHGGTLIVLSLMEAVVGTENFRRHRVDAPVLERRGDWFGDWDTVRLLGTIEEWIREFVEFGRDELSKFNAFLKPVARRMSESRKIDTQGLTNVAVQRPSR